MAWFSESSRKRLETLDDRLYNVLSKAIRIYDFAILCGHRGQAEQDEAVANGTSKLPWPRSAHNSMPSRAVDVAPWPIDWKNEKEFYYLAGLIIGIAYDSGIKLKWGGRWKSLNDLPHIELDE